MAWAPNERESRPARGGDLEKISNSKSHQNMSHPAEKQAGLRREAASEPRQRVLRALRHVRKTAAEAVESGPVAERPFARAVLAAVPALPDAANPANLAAARARMAIRREVFAAWPSVGWAFWYRRAPPEFAGWWRFEAISLERAALAPTMARA